ncbi:MAG TPA: tRNA lysidine(34) synthetase TilS [Terracidiphilus sp.]|nr:tRNA lysidine(34) synthetase TilS [Terracidiphilus sp.]
MPTRSTAKSPGLRLDTALLKSGLRLAVGVSGGADSVAVLRALAARAGELGLVLHVAHLHHGLRGAEADADLEFVRELAGRLGLPFHEKRIDTASEAARLPGKPAETIEEAARRLRYGWFRELMGGVPAGAKAHSSLDGGNVRAEARTLRDEAAGFGRRVVDAVATAHTLDDQAETVLAKLLRGAWTEGISGIHPVVEFAEGSVVRPLLAVRRAEVEAYLKALGQEWREDSSNRHLTYTRNRIRHELLPLLEGWNPRLREHLAQMAELARDEESWWAAELARVAPEVILVGRPVRGGGRAAAEGVALDLERLRELPSALQRRMLREAGRRLGPAMDFSGTEALRGLALEGRAGQKCELAAGLRAERTHRELRLSIEPEAEGAPAEVEIPVPGEAVGFGLRVRIELTPGANRAAERRLQPGNARKGMTSVVPQTKQAAENRLRAGNARKGTTSVVPQTLDNKDSGFSPCGLGTREWAPESTLSAASKTPRSQSGLSGTTKVLRLQNPGAIRTAVLRNWKPGDRVHLRHSSGPRKVKEVLERMKVSGADRAVWPVIAWGGRIVWMRGAAVEAEPGLQIEVAPVENDADSEDAGSKRE